MLLLFFLFFILFFGLWVGTLTLPFFFFKDVDFFLTKLFFLEI